MPNLQDEIDRFYEHVLGCDVCQQGVLAMMTGAQKAPTLCPENDRHMKALAREFAEYIDQQIADEIARKMIPRG